MRTIVDAKEVDHVQVLRTHCVVPDLLVLRQMYRPSHFVVSQQHRIQRWEGLTQDHRLTHLLSFI
jgi:hypothetical protein